MSDREKQLIGIIEDLYPMAVVFADSYRRNYECGESNHPNHEGILNRARVALGKPPLSPVKEEPRGS